MMMWRFLTWRNWTGPLMAACFALLLAGLQPAPSHAAGLTAGNLETVDENGNKGSCDQIPEAKGGVLVGKIVPCLVKTIEVSASRFSEAFIDWMRPTFYAFLVLTITFFGVKVLQGEGQMQAHGIVLLLKIGFVIALFDLIPYTLLPLTYGIMTESQDVVLSALDPTMTCDMAKYGDANTPLVWAQIDCLLGKLYGFTVGGTDANGVSQPNMLLASSVIGMLSGFFFGGSFGVAVFFLCIGILWGMFSLVIKVVTSFVNAYMIIALYMIISPLFLPLMFFRVTTQYFEKWTQAIIAAILMPVIICTYMVFAMQMYDRVLFADDSLVKHLFDYDFMKQNQLPSSKLANCTMANDPAYRAEQNKMSEAVLNKIPLLQNPINKLLSATQDPCTVIESTNFEWGGFKDKNGNILTPKQAFTQFFRELAIIFLLTWLIDAGFKTLQGAIRPMLGSGSVALTLDMRSKQEEAIDRALYQGKQAMQSTYGDVSGQQFIERTPTAMRNSVTGMMYGITGRDMPSDAYTQPPGSGSSADADDTAPATASSGTTARADAATPAAQRQSIKNVDPSQRRAIAAEVLTQQQLQDYDRLEAELRRSDLPAAERDALNEEYERLLDEIDRRSGGG